MSSEPEPVTPVQDEKQEEKQPVVEEEKAQEKAEEQVQEEEKKEQEVSSSSSDGIQVLICGHTGATGKEVMNFLINDSRISKIVTIGRREVTDYPSKVVQLVTPEIYNLDELSKTKLEITEGKGKYAAAFCCLGTTHGDAGSNEAFRKIDLDGTVAFANVAKSLEIPTLCLVSSVGASSSSWFNYTKTKGLAEEALIALKFERLAIFRPGMLDRGDASRSNEKFAKFFMSSLPVKTLGLVLFEVAMDTEKFQKETPVKIYTNKEIYEIAKMKKEEEEKEKKDEEKEKKEEKK